MNSIMKLTVDLEKTAKCSDLSSFVKAHQGGLALVDVTLVLDHSISMDTTMKNGKRRIDGLRQVVDEVQREAPTRMINFASSATFDTKVGEPNGGTNMGGALKFAREAGVSRCIVISDGQPNDEFYAMDEGKALGRCDTIYVGDKGDGGREFLRRLAKETGGTMFDGDLTEVKALVGKIIGLLGDGKAAR